MMRLAARMQPKALLGVGQGAVVALGLSVPRVVEVALATRAALAEEASEIAPAWHGIRAIMLVAPRLHGVSRLERLREAVPGLFADLAEEEGAACCCLY